MQSMKCFVILSLLTCTLSLTGSAAPAADPALTALAEEVAEKGWLVYGARSENGAWDLFLSRPDGSQRRNITNTPDYEEAAPRFSPDGSQLLYRRMPKGAIIDHDKWGFQGELMLADANGANAKALGPDRAFPWASWAPDGKRLVCLDKKGILIFDIATGEQVKKYPRKGIYQQLFSSPDGKWFCGVANHTGVSWTVVRVNAESGELNPVRAFQNCTPDWAFDSKHIILSSRPAKQPGNGGYGYTQLWYCSGDGKEQRLLYGEDGFHIYGGATSPDGKYVLFTKGPQDGSGSEKDGAPMGILRMADTPIITGESKDLRTLHPKTNPGPVLMLETVWEPDWTYAEIAMP